MLKRHRYVVLVAGVLGLSLLSCGREVTGPEDGVYPSGRTAALALDPRFPALPGANLASDIVPFVNVRVLLLLTDGTVAKDTLVDFPSTADSISLVLRIPLPRSAPDSGVTLGLSMAYLNSAGDTVFRGGPLPVTAKPAGSPGASQPVSIPITWVPPGPVPASVTMSPDTGSAVAGSTTGFTAVARDAQGSIIPGTPVAFSSVDTTRAVMGGPGSGLVTWRARRGPALIIATLLNGPADTSIFQVSLPPSRLLLVSGDAQSATVNTALGQPLSLRVTASDSVPVAGVPVTFSVTSGGGVLSATADTSDASGLVSFSWTLGSVVGEQGVTAAATGITGATRVVTATGTAPLPTQLAITAAPTAAVAGTALAPVTIEARDATGQLTPLFTGAVSVALDTATAAGATLAGSTTVNAVAGIATFADLSITRASTGLALIVSSGALAPDTSAALNITAAAAAQLASVSGGGQAGAVLTSLAAPYVARVTDAFGNPVSGTTVTWAVTGGVGTVSASTTLTDAAGEASSTLTLGGTLGSVTVAATAEGLSGSPQFFSATATAGAPAQLFFSQSITSAAAGSANEWIVQVRDAAGNVASDFNGPVSVALINGPPTAVLGGTTTVNAVNGFATFNTLTVDLAATTYRLVASSAGLPDAQSAVLTITPAAPATVLAVSGAPTSGSVGDPTALPFTVHVEDAFGNRNASIPVLWRLVSGGDTLATAAIVTDGSGQSQWSPTLPTTAGPYSVLAVVDGLAGSPASFPITATAGAPAALQMVAQPSNGTAAAALATISVRAVDGNGNLAPSFTGGTSPVTVSIASGPVGASLSGSTTTNPIDGVATFSGLALDRAGSYTLRFSSAGISDAISASFDIAASAATQLAITSGAIGAQVAGVSLADIVVEARDAQGNRVTGFTDSVSLRVETGPPGAPTDSLRVAAVDGLATFTAIQFDVAGTYTLRYAAAGLADALSESFVVNAAAAETIAPDSISNDGQTGTVGQPLALPLRAVVLDAFANRIAGVSVVFTGARGIDTLSVDTVSTNGSGVASLTPTLPTTPGPVAFTVTSDGLIGSGFPFLVTAEAGALAQLALVAQPDSATALASLPAFIVEGRDSFGNLASSFAGAMTAAIDSGVVGAVLGGTTVVNATVGTASFADLTLDLAGTYRLRFTAGATVSSSNVVVLAGAPATMVATGGDAQTAVAFAALPDSLTVRVTDAGGNPVPLETVVWTVLTGDGALSSAAVATDAGGFASVAWTLGGVVGTQTVSAQASGLSAVTFSATATATSANIVWTGTSSTIWRDAGNWSGGVAPTAGDSVRIAAGTPNSVVLDTAVFVTHLIVDAGAIVQLDTFPLFLSGSLDVQAGASVLSDSIGSVVLVGSGTVRGTMPRLYVQAGPYELDGALNVTGDLGIINGQLEIGVFASSVGGALMTTGAGTLAMTGGGALTVTGDAIFAGGSTAGLLTNGTLTVLGDFTQGGGSASAFSASPGHAVVLEGPVRQEVTLLNPDTQFTTTCSASCFGSLRAVRAGGSGALAFLSDVKVLQALEVTGDSLDAFGVTLLAANAPSVAADVVIAGAVGFWNNPTRGPDFQVDTLIAWSPASPTLLPANDSIPTIVVGQHAINAAHPGAVIVAGDAGTLNLEGSASVGSGTGVGLRTLGNGRILMQDASDTLVVNGDAEFGGLTLPGLMTNGQLTISGSLSQTGTGSTFRAEGSHVTRFTGAGTTIAFSDTAANQLNTVEFAATGALEFVSGARLAGNVLLDAGITFITGTPAGIRLGGDLVDAAGGRWAVPLTQFDGVDPQLPDSISGSVILTQSTTLDGRFAVAGDLSIAGGTFDVGGRSLIVGANLAVSGGAIFRMASAADTVAVNGNASFAGASTAGHLSAGVLSLRGALAQSGTAESFAASGSHETWFRGGDSFAQTVAFSNPGSGAGTSHFANLGVALVLPGASVTLSTDAFADGTLLTAPSAARGFDAFASRVLTSLGADVTGLRMNNVRWALLDGGPIGSLDSLVFLNQDSTVVQLAITRGSGTLALTNPQFQSLPTTGRYLSVNDIDGATGGVLTVNVSNPVPVAHGGFLEVLGGAVVNGWDASVGSQLAVATAAAGAASGAAFTTQPVIEIRDAQANVVATDNSTQVTLSVSAGATVLGTATVTAVAGVATFTDVGLTGTAALYDLTYTAAGLSDATQQVTLAGGAAAALAITSGPIGPQVAGVPLATVVVEARDAVNNLATGFTGQVVARVERDGVPGDSVQVAAVAGVASFAGAVFETAGPANVRFSAAGLTDAVSDTFVVAAAAAAQIGAETATTVSGFAGLQIPNPLQVRVEDAFLNRVAGTSVDFVYLRGLDTLSTETVLSDANGLASFQPVLALTPGESQVIARATGLLNSPLVFTVNVFVGPAVELRMVAQPVATTAGATLAPVSVEATDQFGNRRTSFNLGVTVLVDSGPVGAVLSGTTTVNAVGGLATFNTLSLDLAGTYRFRFVASGLADTVSTNVVIDAGAASEVVLTTAAAGAASGAAFTTQPVVEIRDAFGNLVNTDSSTLVTLTVSGDGTVVGPDTVTSSGGVATFTAAGLGGTIGNYTLTYSAGGLTAATQGIALGAGTATALYVEIGTGNAVAGEALSSISIAARDNFGNIPPDFTAAITATIDSGTVGATLSGTTAPNAVAGTVNFDDLSLDLVGTYRLRFSSPGLTDAVTADLAITPAAPASVIIVAGDAQTGPVSALLPDSITIRLRDAFTNPIPATNLDFFVSTGGGSTSPLVAATNAAGEASTAWTLGSLVGTQEMIVTVPGFPGVQVTVAATGTSTEVTWTGGAGTSDWLTAANWAGAAVPTATDSVVVPPTLIAPVIPAGTTLRAFVSTRTATPVSTSGSVTITETISVPTIGGLDCGINSLEFSNAASTMSARGLLSCYTRVLVGTLATDDTLIIAGGNDLQVEGSAILEAGAGLLSVEGNLGLIGATSLLRMLDDSAHVLVNGGATFSGGASSGQLTAGLLELRGNFTQNGDVESFAPSGTHVTAFVGDVLQQVEFTNPGQATGTSHFANLSLGQVEGGVSVRLNSDAYANGQLRDGIGGVRNVSAGVGGALFSQGANLSNATFDGVRWEILDGATVEALSDITFINMPTTVPQFSVTRTAGVVTATNFTFATPPSTGVYVRAEDPDGALNGSLVVSMSGTSPVGHGGAIAEVNTATIVGWIETEPLVWTGGAATSDWNTAGNWNLNRVPGGADSVVINGDVTVTIATSTSVTAIVAGETGSPVITLNGGATLNVGVTALFTATSTVTLNTGAVLAGPGAVSFGGVFNWLGGTLAGGGSTLVAPGGTASIATLNGINWTGRPFSVGGTANIGGSPITLSGLPALNVLSGGTLQFTLPASLLAGGQLINAGTVRKTAAAGTVRFDWPIANTGTIDVEAGLFDLRGLLTHASGTISIQPSATLAQGGQLTATSGVVAIDDGGTLLLQSGGTAPNIGFHELQAGTNVTGGGTLRLFNADTVTINGAVNIDSLVVGNTTALFQTDSIFAARVSYLGGGFFSGSSVIAVSQRYDGSPGNMQGTGTIAVLPGAILETRGPIRGWDIDVAGTMVWGDYNLSTEQYLGQDPAISIRTGALLELQHAATARDHFGNSANVITNAGTIRKAGSAGTTIRASTINAGLIDVLGGTLTLQGGCTVTGGTSSGAGTLVGCVPAAPSGLTALTQGATQIDLAWTDNSIDETGFAVDRCATIGCGSFATIATLPAGTTSYSDVSALADQDYTYRIRATNGNGSSAPSLTASASTFAPAAPSGLSATAVGPTQIDLAWTDNSNNETEFLIERCSGVACSDFVLIASRPPGTVAYADEGLAAGQSYTYRLRASNSVASSAFSNQATATTPP